MFALAAQRRLIVSLGAPPQWQADLRPLAARHPSVPVLCHALGVFSAAEGLDSPGLAEVLASAAVPNILLKVSGLHYVSARAWDFPWPDAVAGLERLHDAYGPHRLCWGSDFPACTRYTTFRQSLEVLRSHCPFLSPADLRLILGENLRALLASGQARGASDGCLAARRAGGRSPSSAAPTAQGLRSGAGIRRPSARRSAADSPRCSRRCAA